MLLEYKRHPTPPCLQPTGAHHFLPFHTDEILKLEYFSIVGMDKECLLVGWRHHAGIATTTKVVLLL